MKRLLRIQHIHTLKWRKPYDMFMKYIAILCDYYRVALHIPLPPVTHASCPSHIFVSTSRKGGEAVGANKRSSATQKTHLGVRHEEGKRQDNILRNMKFGAGAGSPAI
jgi:hypothetical protein